MTKIFLIRHAEAEGNLYRIAQGQDNSPLTDLGWRQVKALEHRFKDIQIDSVYSSDLYRTCATASAIYKAKGLPLQRHKGLREICLGIWEKLTWGEIYYRWPEQMLLFKTDATRWEIDGAERPKDAQERILSAIRDIAAANEGKTVAVFSHGYVILLLLAALKGIDLADVRKMPTGDNTAVSLLEIDGNEIRVLFHDDNSHIKTSDFLVGEKIKQRANGLEAGLRFRSLQLPEDATLFQDLVRACWNDNRPFDRQKLLNDAGERETLVAYQMDDPVGLVQLGKEDGWISLCCILPEKRNRGFAGQLIGQAVYRYREKGTESLYVSINSDNKAKSVFIDYGFKEFEHSGDRTILKKNIRLNPEFLSP